MQRGAIYFHSNLQFKDSFFGSKYLVLLNKPLPNIPPLFVKVPSQQRDKPVQAGCLEERKLFFLPAKTTYFPLNTWVQLYEIYEIRGIKEDKNAKLVGSLDESLIERIVKCLLYSCDDDIMPVHRRYLSPPPKHPPAIQQLATKFNKHRPK